MSEGKAGGGGDRGGERDGKLRDERGQRFLSNLMEADPGSLDVASDEEVERQMDAAGVKAERVPTVEELLARAETRKERKAVTGPPTSANQERVSHSHRPLPHRRSRWSPVTVGTAIALAALVVLIVVNRRAILHGEGDTAIQADLERSAVTSAAAGAAATASAQKAALARSIRQQALAECGLQRYDECASDLDQANKIAPAGESAPDVVSARAAIQAAKAAREQKVGPK